VQDGGDVAEAVEELDGDTPAAEVQEGEAPRKKSRIVDDDE
jgi:hypothetical protein